MSLNKTNYIAIARIIRHILSNSNYFHPMVDSLTSYFKDDNPLFEENKFRKACRTSVVEDGGELKDKDGEARANKDVITRLNRYQTDKYGCKEATVRMNEKFKKLNEEIKKEKSQTRKLQ